MARGTWTFLGALFALLLAFAAKALLYVPPAVDLAPAVGVFDTSRALGRLQRILGDQQPHPVDSQASDGVRDRLVNELRAAGLEPRIADTPRCAAYLHTRTINCERVRNVVVTIGPPGGKHLLLVSHYDSNTSGPGAADDGIGVAGMIEIAAILRTEPLQRPVTFLFDEGEETGLSGAGAFLDSDPVAGAADSLINLEARGSDGPAIMFETSRPNAAAIRAFAAGSSHPYANSLSTDFYRLIPNSTDVTVFAERPWTILNFAIIGNETRYHSAGDVLAALDPRSLQHMGSEALGIARQLAIGGTPEGDGTLIYADLYGLFMVSMPLLLGLALLGALAIFFLVAAWRAKAFGRALLAPLAALVGSGLLGWGADMLVTALRPADYWRGHPVVTFTAFYAVALLFSAAALLLVGRSVERERLRAAFWLVFILVGGLVCWVAPGGAIYFLFPPLLAAPAFLWGRGAWALSIGAGLLLFVTFSEVLTAVELLLIDGPYWILAPLGALAAFPLLIEAFPTAQPARRTFTLVPIGGAALALWAAVLFVPRATDDRQQLFTIEYLKDGDRSLWAVSDKAVPLPAGWAGVDGWQLADVPYSGRRRWVAPAPDLPVPPPTIEAAATPDTQGGGRVVRLVLHANGADAVTIRLPVEARLAAAGLEGQMVTPGGNAADPATIRCYGRSCDGMRMELRLLSAAPVEIELMGSHYRLPEAAAPLVAARPANSRPQYSPDSTYVIGRARL
jgi:Peptidase family M28